MGQTNTEEDLWRSEADVGSLPVNRDRRWDCMAVPKMRKSLRWWVTTLMLVIFTIMELSMPSLWAIFSIRDPS